MVWEEFIAIADEVLLLAMSTFCCAVLDALAPIKATNARVMCAGVILSCGSARTVGGRVCHKAQLGLAVCCC